MVVDPYSGLRQSHLLEDGHIRCKQLTMLLEWVEEFEAESHQNGDAVAFSVLLGDLNFDNCSQGKKLAQVEPRDPALPTKKWFSSTEHAKEQGHKFFSSFQDPCRLGPCQEQSWALGTVSGEAGEQACGMCQLGCLPLILLSLDPTGTILNSSMLHHSIACSPEMLRRALQKEKGRRLYLAGPLHGSYSAHSWKGRRLDYITYRGVPGSRLSPVSASTSGCWACSN